VGRDYDADAARLRPKDRLLEDGGVSRVKIRRRLVEQHDLRVHGERPGEGDPLCFPTRERERISIPFVEEADRLQCRVCCFGHRPVADGVSHAASNALAPRLPHSLPVQHVPGDGRVEQTRLLEHHADLPANGEPFLVREPPDVGAVPRDRARVRPTEHRKQAK
jgi:hypothetical protein